MGRRRLMSDLDILQDLIKGEASVSLIDASRGEKSSVILEESASPGKSPYSITIKGIPRDTIVIKTDKFSAPNSIFKCQKGECRRADYVIITRGCHQLRRITEAAR